jgi:rhamnosyltransferase
MILMGTYNGGRFLEEQIQSIQAQTFKNWHLLIRDDGSSDSTVHILSTYHEQDSRIKMIVDDKGNQGPSGNYNILCTEAAGLEADIIFFSDQDDVWLPNKLETQVQAVRNLEQRHGKKLPVLVYTDLSVVDMQLKIINNSFLAFQGVKNIASDPLLFLLAQNFIPACASAINRALLQIASPIPENALMHDWWVALCAAACGKIKFIPRPMGLYRQHCSNAVGAKGLLGAINPLHGNMKSRWQKGRDNFIRSIGQARQLKKRVQCRTPRLLHQRTLSHINAYADCLNQGRVERFKSMRKHGISRQGLVYGTLFYILLLLQKRQGRSSAV